MNNQAILKPHLEYRLRTIAKRPILFGKGNCYELNEVAVEVWTHLDGLTNVAEIVEQLSKEYSCPVDVLEKDVIQFIEFLQEIGAVEEGI